MKVLHFYSRFSAFVLFFFMSFLPFFFLGIDAEYNLNQQIDRGYISRNAIFFMYENGAQLSNMMPVAEDEGELSESADTLGLAGETIAPMENTICTNQLTCVENTLLSGGSDYFAAMHTGRGRYVYYEGKVQLPPLLDGRFLSSEECLSRAPLAVIGKELINQTYVENGKTYIFLDDLTCEVIGIAGLDHESTLDFLYFINIGSIPAEKQIGRYYIDGLRDMTGVFDSINRASLVWMQVPVRELQIPMTYTDAVTGNVYLKDHIKLIVALLLVFIYLSILNQALSAEKRKIGIMKVVGIGTIRVAARVHLPLIAWGGAGIVLTLLTGIVLIGTQYFALPLNEISKLLGICCCISAGFLTMWGALFHLYDLKTNLREVTQQL